MALRRRVFREFFVDGIGGLVVGNTRFGAFHAQRRLWRVVPLGAKTVIWHNVAFDTS